MQSNREMEMRFLFEECGYIPVYENTYEKEFHIEGKVTKIRFFPDYLGIKQNSLNLTAGDIHIVCGDVILCKLLIEEIKQIIKARRFIVDYLMGIWLSINVSNNILEIHREYKPIYLHRGKMYANLEDACMEINEIYK